MEDCQNYLVPVSGTRPQKDIFNHSKKYIRSRFLCDPVSSTGTR